MKFSYYYNKERTHAIVCSFDVTRIEEIRSDVYQVRSTISIEEVKDGLVYQRERLPRVFTFNRQSGDSRDDLDFIRERYGDEDKWVFQVRNRRDSTQTGTVGIITETARENPLEVQISYDSKLYRANVRANNLSRIEDYISGPSLDRVVFQDTFDLGLIPEEMNAVGITVDEDRGVARLENFNILLKESTPASTEFKISMNLAPEDVRVGSDGFIASFIIDGIGTIEIEPNSMFYKEYGQSSSRIQIPFTGSKIANDFYENGLFKSDSELEIAGDGIGQLKIRYAGVEDTVSYRPNSRVGRIILSADHAQELKFKVANMVVYYTK